MTTIAARDTNSLAYRQTQVPRLEQLATAAQPLLAAKLHAEWTAQTRDHIPDGKALSEALSRHTIALEKQAELTQALESLTTLQTLVAGEVGTLPVTRDPHSSGEIPWPDLDHLKRAAAAEQPTAEAEVQQALQAQQTLTDEIDTARKRRFRGPRQHTDDEHAQLDAAVDRVGTARAKLDMLAQRDGTQIEALREPISTLQQTLYQLSPYWRIPDAVLKARTIRDLVGGLAESVRSLQAPPLTDEQRAAATAWRESDRIARTAQSEYALDVQAFGRDRAWQTRQ